MGKCMYISQAISGQEEKRSECRSKVWKGDKEWKFEFIHNHILMLNRTLHFQLCASNYRQRGFAFQLQ